MVFDNLPLCFVDLGYRPFWKEREFTLWITKHEGKLAELLDSCLYCHLTRFTEAIRALLLWMFDAT
jgi:hypothetical protein